jgi:hypothetical protein
MAWGGRCGYGLSSSECHIVIVIVIGNTCVRKGVPPMERGS